MRSTNPARLLPLLLTVLALCAGPALAYERKGAYVGGGMGVGKANLSDDARDFTDIGDDDVLLVEGHGGYRFNRFFALEGEILGGANDTSNGYRDIAFAGVSGRAVLFAPVGNVVDLFALVGAYTGSSSVGVSNDETESGPVYGAGIQLNFGSRGQFGFRAQYESYQGDKLVDDVGGVLLAFQYNFFR